MKLSVLPSIHNTETSLAKQKSITNIPTRIVSEIIYALPTEYYIALKMAVTSS